MRALVADKLGYQALSVPDKVQGWFDAGNQHELECLVAMRADGWDIGSEQDEIFLDFTSSRVTGHLDGIATRDGRRSVLEIKSPNAWSQFLSSSRGGNCTPLTNKYLWQIAIYQIATGLEAVIACVEEGRVKTFGIEVPPHSLSEIEGRVAFMEELVELGKLPTLCSQKDWPCPVGYLCVHEDGRVVDPEIDVLVMDREAIRVRIKADQAALKVMDAMILDELGERESVETEVAKVTRYATTRKRLDTEALQASGVDLTPFEEYSVTESIRITWRGE